MPWERCWQERDPEGHPLLPFCSVLVRRVLITPRVWLSFPLPAFVWVAHSTKNSPFLSCSASLNSLHLCILRTPQLTLHYPPSSGPHHALSTVCPHTACGNHFEGIIFCLLIVSLWVLSLHRRHAMTAKALPSLTPPPPRPSLA